ncbi:LysM peptidoglycan-binding domain-containing protein [Nocardioides sp. SYSU DS0651]|uniref:LysM peptidoglycan-binding domain-containing protein n=1 Tax=Nocardioides sp. SYSU DS0651 TaxID=3415955 RepID=UPI003F4BB36D
MSTITLAPHVSARPAHPSDPSRPSRAARPSGQVRLTRRGRLAVLVIALALLAALVVALAGGSVATDERGAAAQVEVVTVAPGDTLWDIASEAAAATGAGDVRDMMERIQRLNTLDSSLVYAGQELRVPAAE